MASASEVMALHLLEGESGSSTRNLPHPPGRESQIIIKPGSDASGDDGEVDPKIFDIDSTMMITTMVMMIGVGESGLFAEGSHTNCPRCCRAIVSRPFCPTLLQVTLLCFYNSSIYCFYCKSRTLQSRFMSEPSCSLLKQLN